MLLPDYINELGIAEFAAKFNVAERTAYAWKRRERFPRKEKAREIETASRKRVTFAECYQ
jgi:hypothetical protein